KLGPSAREQCRWRGAHRERAAPQQIIFEPDLELLRVAQHDIVDRDRQAAFELQRRRIMVLQALPDAGQGLYDRNAQPRQMLLRADARQHQQLRRVDGAAAQDDLARGMRFELLAAAAERDTDRVADLEEDPVAEGLGYDLQVAPLHRRP